MNLQASAKTLRDPAVRSALRAAFPLLIPTVPFALVLGVAINESSMPAGIGWASNIVVFAGASQLAIVSLAATATWITLVVTASVINLRHVMYSAALAHRFGGQPTWFRWFGPFLLIDQLFALVAPRTDMDDDAWRRYYLAAGLFYFFAWTLTVTIGLMVGSAIPSAWRLDVAPAMMFAGLIALGISSAPGVVAAVTGGLVCLVSLQVPNNGGILIGALAGVVAGFLAESVKRS